MFCHNHSILLTLQHRLLRKIQYKHFKRIYVKSLFLIFEFDFSSALCDPKPSPLSYLKNEHICGRPLGLRFDKKTGDLYIADAYLGLLKVGPEGGLATSLTTEAEGVPLWFTNDLDVDDEGNVYFTDSSSKYRRRYSFDAIPFFFPEIEATPFFRCWQLIS